MTALEHYPIEHYDSLSGGLVIPFPEQKQDTDSILSESERAFLTDFHAFAAAPEEYKWPYESDDETSNYLKAEDVLQPIDLETRQHAQARKLALAVHRFCARTGYDAVLDRELRRAEGEKLPKLYAVPEPSITWRINRYYRDFGTNRHTKPQQLANDEEVFLRRQAPIYAVVYDAERSSPTPRYMIFPELGYAIVLKQLMERLGNQVAADSAEAVLAAYGDRFIERAVRAGQLTMAARQQRHDTR